VSESLKHLDLAPKLIKRMFILGLVWPQDFCHRNGEEPIVPRQIDLVPAAPGEPLQHRASFCDLRSGLEVPARPFVLLLLLLLLLRSL
jgi:hypothetical protein